MEFSILAIQKKWFFRFVECDSPTQSCRSNFNLERWHLALKRTKTEWGADVSMCVEADIRFGVLIPCIAQTQGTSLTAMHSS